MRTLGILALLLVLALSASAQQATPVFDIFGGLSINRATFGPESQTAPGFEVSFSFNPFRYLRLTADYGGQYKGTDLTFFDLEVRSKDHQLLFGPEFVYRNESRATPFVRAMVGWASHRYNVPTGQLECTGFSCTEQRETIASNSGLALAAGGGLEYSVWDSLAIRGHYDFLRTRLGPTESEFAIDLSDFPSLPRWQSQHRLGFGVVLRWGERQD